MNRSMYMLVLMFSVLISACGDSEQEKKMQEAQLEAMRAEAARIEALRDEAIRAQQAAARMQAEQAAAIRREEERIRAEKDAAVRRQENTRKYARRAGQQIMNAIGGGQDLIVNHQLRYYDATAKTLEIAMEVSFNGAVFRSNQYKVNGVLTIGENGRNPRFARQAANQKYMDQENTMIFLGGALVLAGGAYVLSEMEDESAGTKSNASSSTKTLNVRELELCNGLGTGKIYAAYYLKENGQGYTRGWFALEPGKCAKFKPVNTGKKGYAYAYSTTGKRIWSGDDYLCIDPKNAFKLKQSGGKCPDGSTAKGFFAMQFTKPASGLLNITFNASLDKKLDDYMASKSN